MILVELETILSEKALLANVGDARSNELGIRYSDVADDESWVWLPTTRDMEDPFHGESLVHLAKEHGLDAARRREEMRLSKQCMVALRAIPEVFEPLLVGPNNFTPAAKGAAVFATRMAVREIVTDKVGPWCSMLDIYGRGYWPCGYYESGELVVW